MSTSRELHATLSLAALAVLSACDVPTSSPIYDTVWNVPSRSTSIAVSTLLPTGVQMSGDNTAFQIAVSPASISIAQSLGQSCSACSKASGLITPKPAFVLDGSARLVIPSTVASATLVHDTLTVSVANGFNFDPIRPSATARGYFILLVRSGALIVGRDSIDGRTSSLPADATISRKIPLSGTISSADGLQITTSLHSPSGDPVALDATHTITATASVGKFFVSAAQVRVANQRVTSAPTDLDLSGVDQGVSDRASGGSLLFTVANPFNVAGDLEISFAGAASPITKIVLISAGTTAPVITFSRAELNALLGRNVSVVYGGIVNGSSVAVIPGQAVAVSSRLQIAIAVGGK